MRSKHLFPTLLLSVLVASGSAAAQELAAVDKPAPNFRLPVYNQASSGSPYVGLDRFVGPQASDAGSKVVLLSFMASFCAPCKKEMPYLQALHTAYADKGLRVMMVSIDSEPEGMQIIDDLIATNKITYPVLKDRFNLVARRYLGAQSPLPSVFLVKRDGVISQVHRGYNEETGPLFQQEVEKALGLPPGPALMVAPAAAAAAAAAPAPGKVEAAPAAGTKEAKKSPKTRRRARPKAKSGE